MKVRASQRSATLSLPLPRRGGRLPTVSPLAICDGPSTPLVRDSLTPRWAAGSGAHSVGQGRRLTKTAAPTSDPHSPSVLLVYGVGCLQCRLRLTAVSRSASACAGFSSSSPAPPSVGRLFFSLYHFHTFLYTPPSLNPKHKTLDPSPSNFAIYLKHKLQK